MTIQAASGGWGEHPPVIEQCAHPALRPLSFRVTMTTVGAALLLGWDRMVDPGVCSGRWAFRRCHQGEGLPFAGWPAVPTRRGLDCADGQGLARYISRAALGRPAGPAERHRWVKRRHLARRAERRAVERQGHRLGGTLWAVWPW